MEGGCVLWGTRVECLAVKKAPHTAPLHPWNWPTRVFHRVHLDFAGPFQGDVMLVAVDAFSKWPDMFLMQTMTVSKTIACLHSLFCKYGYPEQIVTDNGPQFTAEEFATFISSCGVKHIRSSTLPPIN